MQSSQNMNFMWRNRTLHLTVILTPNSVILWKNKVLRHTLGRWVTRQKLHQFAHDSKAEEEEEGGNQVVTRCLFLLSPHNYKMRENINLYALSVRVKI